MTAAETLAVYSTVWLAAALFAVSEWRKSAAAARDSLRGWPWTASAFGVALLAAHVVLAVHFRHGWEHASVVREVAEQSRRVYGAAWSGGVWMNYAFVAAWLAEVIWWGAAPRAYMRRSVTITAALRLFYALLLVNATIVFAAPSRRAPGVALMAVLFWSWRDTRFGRTRPSAPVMTAGASAQPQGPR